MANNPSDQEVLNFNERPLSSDINTGFSRIYQSAREDAMRLFAPRTSIADGTAASPFQAGFIADAFKVRPTGPASTSVVLKAGKGYFFNGSDVPAAIGGIIGVDDLSAYKPLTLTADESIAIDATPGAGQERYDIIEVATGSPSTSGRRLTDSASRDIFNPGTGTFTNTPGVLKTLAWNLNGQHGRVLAPANSTTPIGYKVGVAATVGNATVPAASPGYVIVGRIHMINGQASGNNVTDLQLADFRKELMPGNVLPFSALLQIATTGGGPNQPTVQSLIAPPGLNVIAVGDSVDIARAAMYVYLLGGQIAQVTAMAVSGNFVSPTGPTKEQLSITTSIGNLTAADLARINGAASSNVTNADPQGGAPNNVLGQPFGLIRIRDDVDSGSLPNPTQIFLDGKVSY